MNYYVLILTCLFDNSLFGMQKVRYSETLVPGGRSEITSYLHILPKDVEELVAQLLIHAHQALFPSVSRVLLGHTGLISSVAVTHDGRWALTGSRDNTARLWNLLNPGSSPRVLSGHIDAINSGAITPDGKWALTGSNDNTALLWELSNPESSPRVLSGHTELDNVSSSDIRWNMGLNWIY